MFIIYLEGRVGRREIFHSLVHLQMAATASTGPAGSQEPRALSASAVWLPGAQALRPSFPAFLRWINRELNGKSGSQDSNQCLSRKPVSQAGPNLLCHLPGFGSAPKGCFCCTENSAWEFSCYHTLEMLCLGPVLWHSGPSLHLRCQQPIQVLV